LDRIEFGQTPYLIIQKILSCSIWFICFAMLNPMQHGHS